MKKISIGIAAFLLCIVSCSKGLTTADLKFTEQKSVENTESGQVKFLIAYPEFKDYPALNAKIAELVTDTKRDMEALRSSEAELKTKMAESGLTVADFSQTLTYMPPVAGKDYISVVFCSSIYTGGAHPNNYLTGINYDVKNDKFVSLDDVLLPYNKDWLARLSEAAKADLIERGKSEDMLSNADWIAEGADASEENFAVFKVLSDGVTVIFQEYQVAPYAAGFVESHIPFNALK